jgi:peptide/nickel transport system permease protein
MMQDTKGKRLIKNKWFWFLLLVLALVVGRVTFSLLTTNQIEIRDVVVGKQQDSISVDWRMYRIWIQLYVTDLLHGHVGTLLVRNLMGKFEAREMGQMIMQMTSRSELTLLPGLIVGTVLGVLFGTVVFFLPRKLRELIANLNGLVFSIPDLLLILLLQLLAIQIDQWTGAYTVGVVEVQKEPIYLLPILTVAVPIAAYLFSYTVNACREVMQQEFIRNIQAKGLPFGVILFKHVLRPALDSIFAVLPKMAAIAASSLVVIERLYNIMGMTWYFNSGNRLIPEYARLLATLLICLAVYVMAVKLITSLLRLWVNPALRKT